MRNHLGLLKCWSGCAFANIVIPASVKAITGYMKLTTTNSGGQTTTSRTPCGAFQDMTSLTNVTFASNNITRIGTQAFKGCSNLATINLPSSISYVGNNAFDGCRSLNDINLENVAYIGNSAFQGAFTNVPTSSVTVQADKASCVGSNAFNGTTGLKTVDFSKNTVLQTVAGSAFMNSGVTNLDLSKVTKLIIIQPASFQGCASLSTIALPSSLTSIGVHAFLASGLTSLDLSSTQVTTIDQGAFANTAKLESLKVPNTLTTLNSANDNNGGNNRTFQALELLNLT